MPSDMERAKQVFLSALEGTAAERQRLLEELREEDAELHEKVRRLLEAHAGTGPLDEEPPQSVLRPGTVLGDYEILGEVASGGSGVVYRAQQISLSRVVALKFLRVGEFATEREVERFRAEAESAARLDHPHIVPVYEVGEIGGRHYFSMKLIEGPSLASRVSELRANPEKAVRLLIKVAQAVHHAHQRGLLHRDLKPSNILLDQRGEPYVSDFGIAKRLDPGETLTQTGWAVGTPSYMAPEQVAPERGQVTVQTDVYALGCVLYELLAGRPPFQGHSISEIFRKVIEEEPPKLREGGRPLPRDLETICRKCLNKEPARRYASARELASDLQRWLDREPIQARQASLPERLMLVWQRRPVATSLGAALALLVVVLAVGASLASLTLRESLDRALQAEQDANARLRSSLLAQAKAIRRSGEPGQRHASLDLLSQAASIEPGPDLRDEAITSMSLTDLKPRDSWDYPGGQVTLAVSADLGLRAIGFREGRIEIRKGAGREMLGFLPGFGPIPWVMRFSPDGRLLAVKYHLDDERDSAQFRVWDLETRQAVLVRDLPIHGQSIDFHPSGGSVALVTADRELVSIDLDSGREGFRRALPADTPLLRFRPDGGALALVTRSPSLVRIMDLRGRALMETPLRGEARALCWSPEGSYLAVGVENRVVILNALDGGLVSVLEGHLAEVTELHHSPRASLLASGGWDGTTRLWDLLTGRQILVASGRPQGFSRDGRRLAFSSRSSTGIWEVLHGDPVLRFHGHVGKGPRAVALAPDSKRMASAGPDGVMLWASSRERPLGKLSEAASESLFFEPEGRGLIACTDEGLLRWRLSDSPEELPTGPELLSPPPCRFAAANRDTQLIAMIKGRDVRLLDRRSSHNARILEGYPGLTNVSVSPEGRWVAGGSWRGDRVQVWDAKDGSVQAILCRGEDTARVLFSPDGQFLVAATPEGFQAFHTESWEEFRRLEFPGAPVGLPGSVAFSDDARLAALGLANGAFRLVAWPGGRTLANVQPPEPLNLTHIAISPDSRWLAASYTTNRIDLWDWSEIQRRLAELKLDPSRGPETRPERTP